MSEKNKKTTKKRVGRIKGSGIFQKFYSLRIPIETYQQLKEIAEYKASCIAQVARTNLVMETKRVYSEMLNEKND